MGVQRKQSLLQSFRYALEGLYYMVRHERNARIHVAAAAAAILLGMWLHIEPIQWALVSVAIVLVFASEMLNTVTELTIDLIVNQKNDHAKHVKDVAAGATLMSALAAVVIGVLVFGPPLLDRLGLL